MAQFTRFVWDSDERGRRENARLRNQLDRKKTRRKKHTWCVVPDELYALGQSQYRACCHKKPEYGMRGNENATGLCLKPQRRDAKKGEPSSRSCRDIMRELCDDDEVDEYARQVATLGEEELQKYQRKLSYEPFALRGKKSGESRLSAPIIGKFAANIYRQFPPPGLPTPENVKTTYTPHAAHKEHPMEHEVFNEADGYKVYRDVFSAWECGLMRESVPEDNPKEGISCLINEWHV